MRAAKVLGRLLYHAPPFAAAVVATFALRSPPAPGLAFALAAAYARLCALAAGSPPREEALLLAELLPFLAYCRVFAGGAEAVRVIPLLAESALAGAALLLAEALAFDGARRSRLDSLGRASLAGAFVLAAALAALAMDRLPVPTFLGAAALVACLCGYASRRRAR